jgi:hypothetical protein
MIFTARAGQSCAEQSETKKGQQRQHFHRRDF